MMLEPRPSRNFIAAIVVMVLVALTVLGLIGMLTLARLGTRTAPTQVVLPAGQPSAVSPEARGSGYTLVDQRCTGESCLFVSEDHETVLGLSSVTGYYLQIERTSFGETKPCDSFVLAAGPPAFVQSILALVESGNTVSTRNDAGQPIVSLDLGLLSDPERTQLLSSSEAEPVSLVLLAVSLVATDAPVCFSPFQILRVG